MPVKQIAMFRRDDRLIEIIIIVSCIYLIPNGPLDSHSVHWRDHPIVKVAVAVPQNNYNFDNSLSSNIIRHRIIL